MRTSLRGLLLTRYAGLDDFNRVLGHEDLRLAGDLVNINESSIRDLDRRDIASRQEQFSRGVINNNQITDDPSVSDFDSCGFTTPGATNFLLDDLATCNYTHTVQLCGDDVVLDAGDGFDSYIWYLDENGDGLIDPGDTVVTDGDPDAASRQLAAAALEKLQTPSRTRAERVDE